MTHQPSALRAPARAGLLLLAALLALPGCYASAASRQSKRMVESGFDVDDFGPWVFVSGPASLLLAGGNMVLGSMIPMREGVHPLEPDTKWFHAYGGKMKPVSEVAILCHRQRATWVTGIRRTAGEEWQNARAEKWHFPVCIEALPGRYEVEVHYFSRETEKDDQESVSRQAESTEPSVAFWEADAGQVYLLSVEFGDPEPARNAPPQRHIPRSRDIGTTWWGLEESDWYVRVDRVADVASVEGQMLEHRKAWQRYEAIR